MSVADHYAPIPFTVLTVGSIADEFQLERQPTARARTDTDRGSFGSGDPKMIPLDSVEWDTDDHFDDTNDRLIIRHDGLYHVTANAQWTVGAEGARAAAIFIDNVVHRYSGLRCDDAALPGIQTNALIPLTVGQTVRLGIFQAVFGTGSTGSVKAGSTIEIVRVAALP